MCQHNEGAKVVTEPAEEGDTIVDQLRFRVLGPVEIDHLGKAIVVGNVAQRIVLVQLLLSPNRVVSTETLVDTVWGDDPPPTARRSLQAHVAKLRAALGGADGPLEPRAPGYVLNVDEQQIDLWRSEHLVRQARAVLDSDPRQAQRLAQQARQEWHGEPLADLARHDQLVAQRRRLDELWLGLNELELDAQLTAGDTTKAVERLESLVLERPEHEPFWARLMTAYYRMGRQNDALNAFQRARHALLDGLGIDPSPDLQRLELAVLGQSPDLLERPAEKCPYKGLASYQLDDAERFYGRDELVAELVEAVRTASFVVVVGSSGAGKSSALRAGLVKAVEAKQLSVCRQVCVITPGTAPLRAMYQVPTTADLVIVDQFEELFTLTDGEWTRAEFVRLLLSRVNDGSERVVISLRADFYGHCTSIAELAPLLARRQVVVGPMNERELRTAVTKPAEGAGLVVDADLIDVIVKEAGERSGALPLVSHALVETWHRRSNGHLTLAAYREAGSIAGAIARTAERVYNNFQPSQQAQAEHLFLRLVESGDGSEWVQRKVPYSQIEGSSIDRRAIDLLVDARLLTAGADGFELAHEALIGAWPRLMSWINDNREGQRTHRHLTSAATAWVDVDRDEGTLYRGALLSAVLAWISDAQPDLSDLERDFIEASVSLRDRERLQLRRTNRRLRRQLTAASIAAILALVATGIAVTQQRTASRQRRDAQLALLSSTAANLATSQLDLASLLAVEANRLHPSAGSLGALDETLRAQPSVIRIARADFLRNGGDLVATSADGSTVAFRAVDQLMLVGTADLAVHVQLAVRGATDFALSPSGRRVAVAMGHQILAYDSAGEQIGSPMVLGADESVQRGGMVWKDERTLFVTPTGGGSRLVDVVSGTVVARWDHERARLALVADGVVAGFGRGTSMIEHRGSKDVTVLLIAFRDFISFDGASAARYSPNGSWLAADIPDGVVLLHRDDPKTMSTLLLIGQAPVPAHGIFSPDGKRLATVATSGRVSIYDLQESDTLVDAVLSKNVDVVGATGGFFAPATGKFFVTVGDRLIDLALDDREPLATPTFGSPYDTPVTLRSDGQKALSFDVVHDHPNAWDPDAAAPIGDTSNLYDNTPWFYTAAGQRWGVDGTTATALLENDEGRVVRRSDWKVNPDPKAITVADPRYQVYGQAQSDGTGLVLHDTSTLAPIKTSVTFAAARDSTFAVSRDLSMIARASRGATDNVSTIEVFKLQSGTSVLAPVHLRQDQSTVTALDFSPDGHQLLFGDASGQIGQLDLRSGGVRYGTFPGANGSVLWLNFTPDGQHVVAALGSLSLLWWDARSHENVGTPVVGAAPPDVVFSDTFFMWAVPEISYRYVLVAVPNGLRRWNFDFASWPSIACERAGRNLTHAEWSRYIPNGAPYHVTCPQFPVPTD
jgi:DNA-binding SARP family transcriptional activator/WD40 repeat protein